MAWKLGLCLASLLPLLARGDRAGSNNTVLISGVPVYNYHLRMRAGGTAEVSTNAVSQDGKVTWLLFMNKGASSTKDEIEAFCASLPAIACRARGMSLPFVSIDATEGQLHDVLAKHAGRVEFVEPSLHRAAIPELPGRSGLRIQSTSRNTWNLDRIDQRKGRDGLYSAPSDGGKGVHVYVLDTGIRVDHVEFRLPGQGRRAIATIEVDADGNVIECFEGDTECAADRDGHGTHCAGTIAGRQYGVAKGATVHAVKVLNDKGEGSTLAMLRAIEWVVESGERPAIISASLGGQGTSVAETLVVQAAADAGVTVIVAAGNSADNACDYSPAACPAAITVGASEDTDDIATYSNYGSCVNIVAPGSDITAAGAQDEAGLAIMSGTSMACPHVSGAAALLLGKYPGLQPAEVADTLLRRATPGALTRPKDTHTPNLLLYIGEDQAAPQPEAAASMFTVKSGLCTVDAEQCVVSPAYPSVYGEIGAYQSGRFRADQHCDIQVNSELAGPLVVERFHTINGSDTLTINGVAYSGSSGPNGVTPAGNITWLAYSSGRALGWRLCPPMWTVTSGACSVDSDNCLRSPSYPQDYGNNASCHVHVHHAQARPIFAHHFSTQRFHDKLRIDGKAYSGLRGPSGVTPRHKITWSSDRGTTGSGWKLCPSMWTVTAGECSVDEDDCLVSPHFPDSYGDNERCRVQVHDANARPIDVDSFATEASYDQLSLTKSNGKSNAYSGETGPDAVTPIGQIKWASDHSQTAGGWRLCPTEAESGRRGW
mmetsp:Transcript_16006/g.41410  ORF Transcript_16006/g.41410 Transcript_16006/m.41410 type:complete len:770 (+) Transcript_16006:59-2368(+)